MALMTGIIGAMPEELEALLSDLAEARAERVGPFTLHRGRLEGKPVLIAECGVGKVNAAALTQLMLLRGVSRIIFTGVAGAVDPGLEVGDIVVSSDALQHDVDVRALGYAPGEVPGETRCWQADVTLQKLALGAARDQTEAHVVSGRVVSGDQFIADAAKVRWLREMFDASCAEMEGAAAAQVCAKWGVPFVIIRSISDTADHEAHTDFRAFTALAARRAKALVRGMLRRIEG
jgi:adenosylhomocysteine nucleosidase